MATVNFTTNLALALPTTGDLSGTWGTAVNTGISELVDQALGYQAFSATGGSDTLTIPDAATGVARSIYIQLNGTGGGTVNVPTTKTKMYFVFNNTASAITFKVTGQTGVSIPAAAKIALVSNGTDVIPAVNYFSTAITSAELTGSVIPFYFGSTLPTAGQANHGAVAHLHSTGKLYYSHNSAWQIITSGLGTANSAGTVTPVGSAGQLLTNDGAGGLTSNTTGTGVVTALGINVGSAGAPVVNGGVLGTPSSGTATNLTGLPLTTGVTGTLPTANGGTNLGGATPFTSGGVVYASSTSALATGSALVFDGSSLGVGVTPQAWNSDYKAFNYGSAGLIYGRTSSQEVAFGTNWYRNSAGSFLYSTTGFASYYAQALGVHVWYQAASGTAGNAVTFTQAMTLDASGNLGLAETSPSAYGGFVTKYAGIGLHANSTSGASGLNLYESGAGRFSLRTLNGSAGLSFYDSFNGTERVQINSVGTFIIKNDYQEQTFTANSSTAITLNIVTNGTDQVITLTGTATITMPTATAGKSFLLKLKTGAGAYTVTWSTVKWPSGTAPTLTSTASRMDIFSFFSDGTNWYGTTVGQNYTP